MDERLHIQGKMICCRECSIYRAYESWSVPLYGYVCKRIQDREEAKDIIQDIFLSLMESEMVVVESLLPALLYKMARNRIVNYYRHHACCRLAAEYFSSLRAGIVNDAEETVMVGDYVNIEYRCLSDMPDRYSQVYRMFMHAGYSIKKISDVTGRSERAVENNIFRAKKRVREAMRMAL